LHGDVGVAACTGDSDSHRGIRRIVQSDRQRVLPALVHIDLKIGFDLYPQPLGMQAIKKTVVGAGIEPSVIHTNGGIHIAAGGHFPFLGAGCCVHSVDSVIPRSEIDHVIQQNHLIAPDTGLREAAGTLIFRQMPLKDFAPGAIIEV